MVQVTVAKGRCMVVFVKCQVTLTDELPFALVPPSWGVAGSPPTAVWLVFGPPKWKKEFMSWVHRWETEALNHVTGAEDYGRSIERQ